MSDQSSLSLSRCEVLPDEEWKEIPGYEGYYEVSNMGRVRSMTRTTIHTDCRCKNTVVRIWQGRLMTPTNFKGHYLGVALYKHNIGKRWMIHALVLMAFSGPCPNKMQACHNDGNKFNNRLENLRWDTLAANNVDKKRHGKLKRGHAVYGSKLTEENVKYIRRMKKRLTTQELANKFLVSIQTIYAIHDRKTWTHI